ncbi:MAG: hypothetical protein K6E28_01665 [Eubacterium sp.]|nr:hypothetical protein [Eubacterium sp.]
MSFSKNEKLNKFGVGSSARGRLITAFLMVMSFICIFIGGMDAFAEFQYTAVNAHVKFTCGLTEKLKNNSYKISIEAKTPGAPVPEKNTFTINEAGEGEFLINITEPGTFDYLIYQIKGTDKDIEYDNSRYEVHVYVTADTSDNLLYSVSINYENTAEKPSEIEFNNNSAYSGDYDEPTTETDEKKEKKTDGKDKESGTDNNKNEKNGKNNVVKTGDETPIAVVMIVAAVSFVGIIVTAAISRKKRDQ